MQVGCCGVLVVVKVLGVGQLGISKGICQRKGCGVAKGQNLGADRNWRLVIAGPLQSSSPPRL